jgi:hypothetical protein
VVNITAQNDEQVVATNTGATFDEGSINNAITSLMLETTDVDNTTSELIYTINTAPSNGAIYLSGSGLAVNGTFTQDDINAGRITFDHDGSETSLSQFIMSVDDGQSAASSLTFDIAISPINDNNPVII